MLIFYFQLLQSISGAVLSHSAALQHWNAGCFSTRMCSLADSHRLAVNILNLDVVYAPFELILVHVGW